MLAVLGLAIRRSSADVASADVRTSCVKLFDKLGQHLLYIVEGEEAFLLRPADVQRLAKGVIATHTLRALGKRMWEAAEQLQHQQQPGRRVLAGALDLLAALYNVMTPFMSGSTYDLKDLLRQELRSSGLMDHWARLLLLLSSWAGTSGVDDSALALQLHCTGCFLVYNCSCQWELVRESPCLAYLTSSYLVRLCAALDGGPVYGMPQGTEEGAAAAPAARPPLLPLVDADPTAFRGRAAYVVEWALFNWALVARHSREELHADLRLCGPGGRAACSGAVGSGPSSATAGCGWRQERWRLQVRPAPGQGCAAGSSREAAAGPEPPPALRRWVGCASAPPLHTRAAFEVGLRLAKVAVGELERLEEERRQQQGRRWAAGGGSGAAGHPRLVAGRAGAVAEKALLCARMAFPELSDAASVPAWVHDRMEAYWRLLLRAVFSPGRNDVTPGGPPGLNFGGMPWNDLAELLTDLHVPDSVLNRLPPGPTPDVSAALSAGLLPAVERMLRADEGAGEGLVEWPGGLAAYRRAAAGWAQLLAFGPRPEVFSLLSTAVKKIVPAMGATRKAQLASGALASTVYTAGAPSGEGPAERVPAAAGDGGGSAGLSQLRLAASFVALYLVAPMVEAHGLVVHALFKDAELPPVFPELLTWLPAVSTARDHPLPHQWSMLLAAALLHLARRDGRAHTEQLGPPLRRALWAVACQDPERVSALLADMGDGVDELHAILSLIAASRRGLLPPQHETLGSLLRRVLGAGGPLPDVELLAALEAAAADRSRSRRSEPAVAAPGASPAEQERRSPPAELVPWLLAGKLLAAGEQLDGALPRRCSNYLCANLSGDREADLPLTLLCGCGLPGCARAYCSVRCQAEAATQRSHR
ncbi:hypothetical protein GPECTOR_16g565 [Gonium pectorale]|uniref:MYND-type domain-containing protein n=1 Tax=Gonium pectorale TaxID=33097 RepID=A0A150GKQ5_GONPE|nr:hypothetical protein GPECTOR_16g565 [Gonium pectorale]|eukprot:KXZ50392.1 hypothetical protein GPECTOR_16g565 [Gonium pectorale]